VIAGSVEKELEKGKARKVIKSIIINQPAGFAHAYCCCCSRHWIRLTTHDAFFVLFCTCSCKAPPLDQSLVLPPSPCRPGALSKKESRPNTQTNNHPIYYCCIFLLLLLLLLLGSLSTTNSPIHAFKHLGSVLCLLFLFWVLCSCC
jgi:hypothetical protein